MVPIPRSGSPSSLVKCENSAKRPEDSRTILATLYLIELASSSSNSRSSAFWGCAYQRLAALPVKKHEWIGDQSAMNREVATGNWKTLILPGSQYNYFPTGGDDEVSGRAILHYKGWRKDALMLRRTL